MDNSLPVISINSVLKTLKNMKEAMLVLELDMEAAELRRFFDLHQRLAGKIESVDKADWLQLLNSNEGTAPACVPLGLEARADELQSMGCLDIRLQKALGGVRKLCGLLNTYADVNYQVGQELLASTDEYAQKLGKEKLYAAEFERQLVSRAAELSKEVIDDLLKTRPGMCTPASGPCPATTQPSLGALSEVAQCAAARCSSAEDRGMSDYCLAPETSAVDVVPRVSDSRAGSGSVKVSRVFVDNMGSGPDSQPLQAGRVLLAARVPSNEPAFPQPNVSVVLQSVTPVNPFMPLHGGQPLPTTFQYTQLSAQAQRQAVHCPVSCTLCPPSLPHLQRQTGLGFQSSATVQQPAYGQHFGGRAFAPYASYGSQANASQQMLAVAGQPSLGCQQSQLVALASGGLIQTLSLTPALTGTPGQPIVTLVDGTGHVMPLQVPRYTSSSVLPSAALNLNRLPSTAQHYSISSIARNDPSIVLQCPGIQRPQAPLCSLPVVGGNTIGDVCRQPGWNQEVRYGPGGVCQPVAVQANTLQLTAGASLGQVPGRWIHGQPTTSGVIPTGAMGPLEVRKTSLASSVLRGDAALCCNADGEMNFVANATSASAAHQQMVSGPASGAAEECGALGTVVAVPMVQLDSQRDSTSPNKGDEKLQGVCRKRKAAEDDGVGSCKLRRTTDYVPPMGVCAPISVHATMGGLQQLPSRLPDAVVSGETHNDRSIPLDEQVPSDIAPQLQAGARGSPAGEQCMPASSSDLPVLVPETKVMQSFDGDGEVGHGPHGQNAPALMGGNGPELRLQLLGSQEEVALLCVQKQHSYA